MTTDDFFATTIPGRRVWRKRGERLEKVVVPATQYRIGSLVRITDDQETKPAG